MKPRVFVSSTYYDLKYVRENIQKFIRKFNFEPVLSETGEVTFEHGKELDESCYEAVKQCHMMVLVVGGRYGSAASSEKHRKKYDSEYVSITRKEVETALEMNLPVFIFIDKNVYAEYQTFLKNRDVKGVKYAHVDNVNVFKFIETLMNKPVSTFEKIEEIESYLDNQISGMFYLYLQSLRKEKTDSKILGSVEELKKITEMMNEMLKEVVKKAIGDKAYGEALRKQNEVMMEYYAQVFESNVSLNPGFKSYDNYDELAEQIYDIYARNFFENETLIKNTSGIGTSNPRVDSVIIRNTMNIIRKEITVLDETLDSSTVFRYPVIVLYFKDIYLKIKDNPELRKMFKEALTEMIAKQLIGLPF